MFNTPDVFKHRNTTYVQTLNQKSRLPKPTPFVNLTNAVNVEVFVDKLTQEWYDTVKGITLEGAFIKDYSFLSDFRELVILDISRPIHDDVVVLYRLPYLEVLYASNVQGLSIIGGAPRLKQLYLNSAYPDAQIDCRTLTAYKNLRLLDLRGRELVNIEALYDVSPKLTIQLNDDTRVVGSSVNEFINNVPARIKHGQFTYATI